MADEKITVAKIAEAVEKLNKLLVYSEKDPYEEWLEIKRLEKESVMRFREIIGKGGVFIVGPPKGEDDGEL